MRDVLELPIHCRVCGCKKAKPWVGFWLGATDDGQDQVCERCVDAYVRFAEKNGSRSPLYDCNEFAAYLAKYAKTLLSRKRQGRPVETCEADRAPYLCGEIAVSYEGGVPLCRDHTGDPHDVKYERHLRRESRADDVIADAIVMALEQNSDLHHRVIGRYIEEYMRAYGEIVWRKFTHRLEYINRIHDAAMVEHYGRF